MLYDAYERLNWELPKDDVYYKEYIESKKGVESRLADKAGPPGVTKSNPRLYTWVSKTSYARNI